MPLTDMYASRIIITAVVSLLYLFSDGQACSIKGQTPATAFPVCGVKTFQQTTVPLCSSHKIKVPGCGNGDYQDKNPFWYQFTCYASGTLGFLITPNDLGDDYDWQLFDITGHAPQEVFTNSSLVVTGNWSGSYGTTGARTGGSAKIECASDPAAGENTFAAMPNLILGHVYLLMISHFTDSQSGYGITFSGGTASITDPNLPKLTDIRANCEGSQIILRLNKKMKCSSLAADGSDFTINTPAVTIVSALAPTCETGYDMDSVILTLSTDLSPGNYIVSAKTGSDGNSLLDNCDNALADGDSLPLVITPKLPTPFDSIAPVSCAPQVIELPFKKPIQCNSIAADGSDFSISGNQSVSIDGAYGNCTADGTSSSVFIHFSSPVVMQGTYTITTKLGSDGNVVVDECGQETPVSQSVSFFVKDTVSAAFDARLNYGCVEDTIIASHDGSHDVNNWQWLFSTDLHRTGQTTQVLYGSYGEKDITLVVSNGFCSDTVSSVVNLDNELKAGFNLPPVACPNEAVIITDTSTGNIISYQWGFGNGNHSSLKQPLPQTYVQASGDRQYHIELIVENNLHCMDTLFKPLMVAYSCHIAVPSAFTPNGDGINDYLYPVNAYKADNLVFSVYNRLGQLIFQAKDRTRKWDGNLNGQPQPAGTYVWTLQYTLHDTQQFLSLHGTAVLIR